jgi:protein-tyrosine-phosphatase
MAEAILRARLAERAPHLVVGSAGLLFDGRPADPKAHKAVDRMGLSLADHRARTISVELLEPTSLILGMERRHVREVVALAPHLFDRSFTLPELVTLGRVVGPRAASVDLRTWAEGIGSRRKPADYAYDDRLAEVADPYGGSSRAFRECAAILEARLAELVDLAWPTPPGDDVAPVALGGTHADRDRR